MSKGFMLQILTCPRCGEDHWELVRAYTVPPVVATETITHYALCVNTDEPILITRIDNGGDTVKFWRFA